MTKTVAITAIVTAYDRIDQTLFTLKRLAACQPAPDEILVHVDAGGQACADAIRAQFPQLRVFESQTPTGPGGGRNKLVSEARNEIVASFDDDSYPFDSSYFERARRLMDEHREAALIGANIIHRGEPVIDDIHAVIQAASFISCGVVFRRADFLAAGGFVPLTVAYGMEEEDISLRLIEGGKQLLKSSRLRVFHDTDLNHHKSALITSGSISNLALLAFLRYPLAYWPYGALQIANRVFWCLRVGRLAGIATGLASIPAHLIRHRHLRQPVSNQTMRLRFSVRRSAQRVISTKETVVDRSSPV